MYQNKHDLEAEIAMLISLKAEGDYWDFKEKWHTNNADLLYDIICMANNLADLDAYIIIGVDSAYNFAPIANESRKNQNDVINVLKTKNFAGNIRPTVYVKTISVHGNNIDILIIKNTKHTPYYLATDYSAKYEDGKLKTVRSGHIYSRIGDKNTDIDKTADIDKAEYLWKKRLGIDLSPLEKVKFLLAEPENWLPVGTDGECSSNGEYMGMYYNEMHPEFTLHYGIDQNYCNIQPMTKQIATIDQDIFWMKKLFFKNSGAYCYKLDVKYLSTVMRSFRFFSAKDNFFCIFWKREHLFPGMYDNLFNVKYVFVEKDSLEFLLTNWLCNRQDTVDMTKAADYYRNPLNPDPQYSTNPYDVIPVFESAEEHKKFISDVRDRQDTFINSVDLYDFDKSLYKDDNGYSQAQFPDYIEYLCKVGKTLVDWLSEMRKQKSAATNK